MTFIDQHRPQCRVELICAVLTELGCQVAPRTYRSWKARPAAVRTVTDAYLTDALLATVGAPGGLYGRRKMAAHLRREGHQVAAAPSIR
ncbi:MAG: putative transposase [Frankiales bacterium]|nr:putative transposase [Frankiales bacterium]